MSALTVSAISGFHCTFLSRTITFNSTSVSISSQSEHPLLRKFTVLSLQHVFWGESQWKTFGLIRLRALSLTRKWLHFGPGSTLRVQDVGTRIMVLRVQIWGRDEKKCKLILWPILVHCGFNRQGFGQYCPLLLTPVRAIWYHIVARS